MEERVFRKQLDSILLSLQVFPGLRASYSIVFRQVFIGRPRPRKPWGFLRVWSIHAIFLPLSPSDIDFWLILFLRSLRLLLVVSQRRRGSGFSDELKLVWIFFIWNPSDFSFSFFFIRVIWKQFLKLGLHTTTAISPSLFAKLTYS